MLVGHICVLKLVHHEITVTHGAPDLAILRYDVKHTFEILDSLPKKGKGASKILQKGGVVKQPE